VVVFGGLAALIVLSPGWDEFHSAFLNWDVFKASFPDIAHAFLLNVKIFCIAEPIILVLALVVAVVRGLPGPVFAPFRALAIAYADFFRGVPTILVILMLGFGMPALGLSWLPSGNGSEVFWGIVALVLVYTAYVSEVYRAGLESVHPSQEAAARSLGLTRLQGLRFVIVPQAVRRVIPPLLNDFIGLQKDTALVSVIGAVEALQQASIEESASFNFTPYVAAAVLFVAITIPLTRFTDYLIARDRSRRQTAGVAA
jgi:polar amino acid transport system permease protein